MKLQSRDFQCFKMIPSIIYFFLNPGTLNNCETMAQRGFLKGRRKENQPFYTASIRGSFQSRNGSLCRETCSPVFQSLGISINTSQMNVKHYFSPALHREWKCLLWQPL